MSDAAGLERDDEAALAADYALGVLDGAARRRAERRMARDPAFAREVAGWEARLSPLALALPEAPDAPDLWARIEAELPRHGAGARPPAAIVAPVAASPGRGRRVSAIWQYVGLGSMGLAAASAAALLLVLANAGDLLGPPRGLVGGAMTATLMGEGGAPLFTVVVDAASGMATFVPVAATAAAGDPAPDPTPDPTHVHELWLVPAGDGAPRSLGLLGGAGTARVPVEAETMGGPEAAIAISLEPAGGSPTGRPTGPVVASGPLRSI